MRVIVRARMHAYCVYKQHGTCRCHFGPTPPQSQDDYFYENFINIPVCQRPVPEGQVLSSPCLWMYGGGGGGRGVLEGSFVQACAVCRECTGACMHACMHTRMHTCMHAYTHAHMHARTYALAYTHTPARPPARPQTRTYAYAESCPTISRCKAWDVRWTKGPT